MAPVIIQPMSLQVAGHQTDGYIVSTDVYEGPLDLLLTLIERAELDITRLSLAQVTEEYLEYLFDLQVQDPAEVSAFLVIAARLVQIKSAALLPRPPVIDQTQEEDPGEALVQQLIQYRKFKRIALFLENREISNLRNYLRTAPPPLAIEVRLDLSGVTISDLIQTAQQIFHKVDMQSLSVVMPLQRITIREKIFAILDTLRKNNQTSFNRVLDTKTRLEIVVTFLALLELIKRHVVQAEQPDLFEDIHMVSLQDIAEEDFDLEFEE